MTTIGLTINGNHLLINGYLPTKFEVYGANCSRDIHCLMCGRPTYGPTCAKQYAPHSSKRGHKITPPSVRMKGIKMQNFHAIMISQEKPSVRYKVKQLSLR